MAEDEMGRLAVAAGAAALVAAIQAYAALAKP